MKRWFIARMVTFEDELRPAVGNYPKVNYRIWTKDGFAFCMGQLATDNLAQFAGNADIKLIPDAALDNTLSTMPVATRTAMQTALADGGFDVAAIRNTWSLRRVLQHLKLQLQPDDVIDSADVVDIEN